MRRLIAILISFLLVTRVAAFNLQDRQQITIENAHQLSEVGEWQATYPYVTHVAFNPTDGTLAAIQSSRSIGDGSITFLDPTTLKPISMTNSLSNALIFAFSPDGSLSAEIDDTGHLNIVWVQRS